jgi:hypothetical protein
MFAALKTANGLARAGPAGTAARAHRSGGGNDREEKRS